MYEFDWKSGNKSSCTICRKIITCKPNRVYGNFPKEKIFYELVKDSFQPNINGKKMSTPTTEAMPTVIINREDEEDYDDDDDNEELVEFYEDRLADLERQLEEYAERNASLRSVENELVITKSSLLSVSRDLNDRNIKIQSLIKEKLELMDRLGKLSLKLEAATEELESFKHSKMAIEVNRLANHISSIQKESYYKNLLKDSNMTKEFLIGMLSGFEKKNAENEAERNELLKENRMLRISKENSEKKAKQQQQQQQMNQVLKPKMVTNYYDEAGETELDEPICDDNQENIPTTTFINPFAIKPPQTTTTTTKMVPKTLPKGFSIPKNSSAAASTGTGKRQKVLQLPNGQQYFI